MSLRSLAAVAASSVVVVVVVSLGSVQAAAQTSSTPANRGTTTFTSRTPWGDPDLQGIWNNGTVTPLERPRELAASRFSQRGGEYICKAGPRAGECRSARRISQRRHRPRIQRILVRSWDGGGHEANLPHRRSDGWEIPALTPEGQAREAARADRRRRRGPSDSWEDRTLTERCIMNHGVPPLPTGYNNNYQILQVPATWSFSTRCCTSLASFHWTGGCMSGRTSSCGEGTPGPLGGHHTCR